MGRPCCHTFIAFLLKFFNFLQAFIGLSIIIYSVYMLNQWSNNSASPQASAPSPDYHDALLSNFDTVRFPDKITPLNLVTQVLSGFDNGMKVHFHSLPATWFIYALMGVGILLCCVTCVGHIAAEAINGCCLCFYTLLTAILILLEAALVSFIAFDHQWEKDLPIDPTGELDSLRAFIEGNIDVCKWVGITVVIIQALSLLLAMVLRALVSTHRANRDIEEDCDIRSRNWEPLLHPHLRQTSGSIKGDGTGTRSDIWSSRMREKYGLLGGDDKSNLLNQSASVNMKSEQ